MPRERCMGDYGGPLRLQTMDVHRQCRARSAALPRAAVVSATFSAAKSIEA